MVGDGALRRMSSRKPGLLAQLRHSAGNSSLACSLDWPSNHNVSRNIISSPRSASVRGEGQSEARLIHVQRNSQAYCVEYRSVSL